MAGEGMAKAGPPVHRRSTHCRTVAYALVAWQGPGRARPLASHYARILAIPGYRTVGATSAPTINSLSYSCLRSRGLARPGAGTTPCLSLRQNLGDSRLPHRQGGQGGERGEGEQRGEDLPYGEAVGRHGLQFSTAASARAVTRVTGSP